MLMIYAKQKSVAQPKRKQLRTTGLGLGLVRLLLDAGRTKEARTVLAALQNCIHETPAQAAGERSRRPASVDYQYQVTGPAVRPNS